jgi:hypothetical protein
MNVPTTTADLRGRALAELNVQLRRLPSAGYLAVGPGAPGGRGDLIARDEAELRAALALWLGAKA